MYFSMLCMHLGAKEVIVDQIDINTKKGKSTFKVDASGSLASGDVTVEHEELEKLRAEMNLHDRFDGGEPNVDAAEKLLVGPLNGTAERLPLVVKTLGERRVCQHVVITITKLFDLNPTAGGRCRGPRALLKFVVRALRFLAEAEEALGHPAKAAQHLRTALQEQNIPANARTMLMQNLKRMEALAAQGDGGAP